MIVGALSVLPPMANLLICGKSVNKHSWLPSRWMKRARIKTYKVKLAILCQFFGQHPIHTIKTKTIEDYLQWRKTTYKPSHLNFHHSKVSNKTLSADLGILRQALKAAKLHGWITALPDFPKLTVTPRPGGWFSPEETVKLLSFGKEWVAHAATPKEWSIREYAYRYMQWLISTGMRVDEALKVRIEDVQIRRAKPPQRPTDRLSIMTVEPD